MSRENPFSMHRRSFWEAHAGNPRLPTWQRIYALAYGVHRRNGHAPFKAGEIAQAVALADVDQDTGEIRYRVPTPAAITHAITAAVNNGFLDQLSTSACLVVPRHAIEGGLLGKESEVCKQRHRPAFVDIWQTRGGSLSISDNAVVDIRQRATR